MMDFDFMKQVNLVIVLACLLVGFVVKKWLPDVDNKWIPTIVFVIGVILQMLTLGISVENFIIGGVSGLASTGLHQLFKQFLDNQQKSA